MCYLESDQRTIYILPSIIYIHKRVFAVKLRDPFLLLLLNKSFSILGINVDIELPELAGLDFIRKQHVQLFIGTILALGKSEESPDKEEKRSTCPEESSLALQVQCGGVQQVRVDSTTDDVSDIVCNSGKTDTLVAQAGCGCFADDGVADGSDGEVVDEKPHEHHDCLCIVAGDTCSVCGADGTGCAEDDGKETQAPEIQGAAAESGEEVPRDDCADGSHGEAAYGHFE
jgi:hypothetical protein